ncbi:hypothetical protein QYM36_017221 [Artemia franciscana]|uniref:Uncharacterized protein n=1 Tax=Artemia franciscana TaxID=6661 RepID=A0AA88HGW3_ARTSF|nr:hypothetical protein QYM36_017221 [Artemia franciscana]
MCFQPVITGARFQTIISTTRDMLTSYTGEKLKVMDIIQPQISYKDHENQIHPFYVVNTNCKPILSRKTSQDIKLVKFILNVTHDSPAPMMRNGTAKILDEYKDVFEGVGKLPGKCKIHLKEGAVPTVQPEKRIPLPFKKNSTRNWTT